MDWQPQQDVLQQLLGLFRDSLNPLSPNHQQAVALLKQVATFPDIANYCVYIFLHSDLNLDPAQASGIRQSCGIFLKNHIRTTFSAIAPSSIEYVKSQLLQGLRDPDANIRRFTGNTIAELVKVGGILNWPEVISELIAIVENNDPASGITPVAQESAMEALDVLCDDNQKQLEKEYNGQRPLSILFPKFIEFTSSPLGKVRKHALSALNTFLPSKLQAVIIHVDAFLNSLSTLANDPEEEVRKRVCRAFVFLSEMQPEKVAQHMDAIVNYMLQQQQNAQDAELALDAAEFWLTVGEHDQLKETLGPHLEKILPVLLRSMVYSEEDIERLGGEQDDAHLEDRAEDIKPIFAKAKARLPNGQSVDAEAVEGKTAGEAALDELSDGEIEDFSDDDDLDYGTDPEEQWNLRKCSAAALDVLSTVFHCPVFNIILPHLKESLRSPEWYHREAAVLALGAVAAGCLDSVTPHLPELIPFLLSLLSDSEPQVRQITCWTLGRYSGWASHLVDPALRQRYFEPMMEGILTKMLDGNKRVQEAAVSSFANLEEQSKESLTPYIEPIVRQFVTAMGQYKDRNMYILYDCIQTLAEHVGAALAQPELINILMPALINRWKKVRDDSQELFPLLECLSFVAPALGHDFAPYAAPIFHRCINVIHQHLEASARGEDADKDFLVTSLDLLSAVIQALDSSSSELIASSTPPFFDLLRFCMNDVNAEVRQSGYALLGDCAIYVFQQMQPYLPQLMGLLIEELDVTKLHKGSDGTDARFSAVNNACWSCGEIAMQQGTGMQPYVGRLYSRLLTIIQASNISSSLTENAAIALGRLGLGSADELASHLDSFAHPFLDALKNVSETDEKDSALRGFAMVVGRNPEAMESCLVPFFKCIAKYEEPSQELRDLFHQTLAGYKALIPNFDTFLSQLPAPDQAKLRGNYLLA